MWVDVVALPEPGADARADEAEGGREQAGGVGEDEVEALVGGLGKADVEGD